LNDCVGEEYLAWVAQYMVMKRASIEHNFHTLYANFIDHLKAVDLIKLVVKETFRNIKVSNAIFMKRLRSETLSFRLE